MEYIALIDNALGREPVAPSASEAILDRHGSERPSLWSGIDSVRAKAQQRLESWASAARGVMTKVRSIARRRSRKELLGIGGGVAAVLVLVFAAFGTGRLESYIHDLREGDTCEERREAVADLRSLGDKHAIPALKEARRARPAGLLKRRPNSNDCLRADAAEAIRHLESL